jgi:hypothetical protein
MPEPGSRPGVTVLDENFQSRVACRPLNHWRSQRLRAHAHGSIGTWVHDVPRRSRSARPKVPVFTRHPALAARLSPRKNPIAGLGMAIFGELLLSVDRRRMAACHTKPEVVNCPTFELLVFTYRGKWCVQHFASASSAQLFS